MTQETSGTPIRCSVCEQEAVWGCEHCGRSLCNKHLVNLPYENGHTRYLCRECAASSKRVDAFLEWTIVALLIALVAWPCWLVVKHMLDRQPPDDAIEIPVATDDERK